MADYSEQQPVGGKFPRKIFSHAYVPACPVHGCPMEKQGTGAVKVFFRCARTDNGQRCPHTGIAPRVEFTPRGL